MSMQLELFGLTPDENTFQSTLWGLLTFYPSKSDCYKDTCRHCLLCVPKEEQRPDDECLFAHCSDFERADGRNGYFSIHNMPKT